MRWKPNVTVAAIVERDGRFLLVEEETGAGLRLNQPAGHLEQGESLVQAVAREALEETTCRFEPGALIGVYHWSDPAQGVTYLRFAFAGTAGEPDPALRLDTGIVRTVWMTRDEVAAARARHRSPHVLACIDDFLAGRRAALDLIRDS